MKTLTKVRLINWHYIENETIMVKGNTLLTGENGSGKSTIMDAISYVITAGDTNFNLAANDKGKRDLRSYVKCKLGALDQEYLRDYDLSGHICLEFYSEKHEKFFCLGCVIDCFGGELTPPKTLFYIVDSPMKEDFFITNDMEIRSIADFKKAHFTDYIFQTRKEAKSAFRQKMGGISDKYFTLLPKAVAFKPISDVKEYIYNQLLEAKTIDVDSIKDSIRSYKELEQILKTTKKKIEHLEGLRDSYLHIKEIKDNKKFYDYLLKLIEVNNEKAQANFKERYALKLEKEVEDINEEIKKIQAQIDSDDEKSREMYASLSQDKEFRSGELYEKDIKSKQSDLLYNKERRREYERKVSEIEDTLKQIEIIDKVTYKELKSLNFEINSLEDAKKLLQGLDKAKQVIEQAKEQASHKKGALEVKKSQTLQEMRQVIAQLQTLQMNEIPYRAEIVDLRRKMEAYLKEKFNETVSVHIFCELLEVKDKSWQDTIENFLNTQRFTLIVEPKYYDDALDCYNRFKSRNLYGVNLLNTKQIQKFTTFSPNSLASIIETENRDARCYVNYTMGNIIMVSDVRDLEKYSSSITKEGMLYRGYVTRYLNPNTEKPFIGRGAKAEQNSKWNKEGEELKQEFNNLTSDINLNDELIKALSSIDVAYLKDLVKCVALTYTLEEEITDLKNKKAHLSMTSVDDLRKEYENFLENIRLLNQRRDAFITSKGEKTQAAKNLSDEVVEIYNSIMDTEKYLEEIERDNIDYKAKADEVFNTYKESGKSMKETEAIISKTLEEEVSSLSILESGLTRMQTLYSTEFNRPFGVGYDRVSEYLAELDKLVNSELIKYENKVRDAREKAEKLFKEDFLSKLRNYILEAQEEIKSINKALDKITFGREKYQFIFPKSKEFGAIYDMITDNIGDNNEYSVFNEDFEKKYNQELDELFEHLSSDETNSQGVLNKYTDYRTYMDYDIQIYSGGDVFYFSNISKSNSGGELQTPFYVAILASFTRLFEKCEKNGLDDSVGLILFDEVFNRMDQKRIKATMEFINALNVQIIFACPPEKMETLSKHTQTNIIVFRDNKKVGFEVTTEKSDYRLAE